MRAAMWEERARLADVEADQLVRTMVATEHEGHDEISECEVQTLRRVALMYRQLAEINRSCPL